MQEWAAEGGAEAEQVGTQQLPWVAVGGLVRRQPACGVLQSGGGKIETSWETGQEGPDVEMGGLDRLSKESRVQGQNSQEERVLGWMKPELILLFHFSC